MEAKFINVEIDGVQYPVCFNTTALEHIESYTGEPIGDALTKASGSIGGSVTIAWIGLVHGYRVSGQKEKSEALARIDFSDQFRADQVAVFVTALTKFMPNQEEEDGQKKTIQKVTKNR